MKHIALIISVAILSLTSALAQVDISFKLPQLPNEELVIGHYFAEQHLVHDTIFLNKKGVGTFKKETSFDRGIYFVVLPDNKYFELLMSDDQNYSVETDTTELIGNMKIKGCTENEAFYKYQNAIIPLSQKISALSENKQAETSEELSDLEKEVEVLWKKIVEANPNTFLANLLRAMNDVKPNGRDVYEHINFAEKGLLNTPIIYETTRRHIAKTIKKGVSVINAENDRYLKHIETQPEMHKYVLNYLLNFYNSFYKAGMNQAFVHIATKYFVEAKPSYMSSSDIKAIGERAKILGASEVGQIAPDFTMETHLGDSVTLHDMDSKYTLIFFWATGCGHCEDATEHLLNFNAEMGENSDLSIVSVNTRDDKKAWLEYIEENALPWTNVWDPKRTTNYQTLYYIVSTPIVVLLDHNKKVIAKRVGDPNISNLLDQLLSQKETYLKQ